MAPRCRMLEDRDEVLAQAKRVAEEVGALATAVEGLESTQQRAVRTCVRPSAPGCIQAHQSASWSVDDLNLVSTSGRAPAKHRLKRVALDRPVAAMRDRQYVAYYPIRRQTAGPPLRTGEQDLISLTLGDRDRFRSK